MLMQRIGVLGGISPQATMEFETRILQARLDGAIRAVMEDRDGVTDHEAALAAVDALRGRGVDGVVLGCTEIPLLLGQKSESDDLINPAALLAEAAVRRAARGAPRPPAGRACGGPRARSAPAGLADAA